MIHLITDLIDNGSDSARIEEFEIAEVGVDAADLHFDSALDPA
jgi:hypothetical protein